MPAQRMKSDVSKEPLGENELLKVSQILHYEDKASHISVDNSGEKITSDDFVGKEGLFHHMANDQNMHSSLPDLIPADAKSVVDIKGSISAVDTIIDHMIFSPFPEHGELQDTSFCHSIPGSDLPYLVPDDSDFYRLSDTSDCFAPSSICRRYEVFDSLEELCCDVDFLAYDVMFDIPERCMIMPFLGRTGEESSAFNGESVEEYAHHSLDLSISRVVHPMDASDYDTLCSPHIGDLASFDPQLFINNFEDQSVEGSSVWAMLLPKETQSRKTITLVLDLDETLVHSTLDHCLDADFTFPVFFNTKEQTVYVRQRPYLHEFLARVSQMFKIIIFTASQSIYAEQLLDMLDPDKSIISRRMFRESCIFSDGSYIKDLSILGIDLAKVAIIDNSPQVFRLQVNNGIPIKSWFDDPTDCALLSLLPFLESLVDVDDVRPIISERFKKE